MTWTLDTFKKVFNETTNTVLQGIVDVLADKVLDELKDLANAVAALEKAKKSPEPWKSDLAKLQAALKKATESTEPLTKKVKQFEQLEALAKKKAKDAEVANIDLDKDPKAGEKLMKAVEERYGIKLSLEEGIKTPDGVDADGNPKFKFPGKKLDPKGEAETLKNLYDTLGKVPVFPNAKLDKMTVTLMPTKQGAGEGGWYWESQKSIGIECKRPKDSMDYGADLNTLRDFPDPKAQDPDCAPANKDKVNYFSWATLHEVGHAVDAKNGFMNKKGKDAKYGKWVKTDIAGAAKAVAGKFKALLTPADTDGEAGLEKYALGLLGGGTTAPATPAQTKVKDWVATVKVGGEMWWDGTACKNTAVGDTVYQESYDDDWWTYSLSARTKGIHGYQFRAPAEWFAELYAAYYSKKLKDSHPFVPDLKALEK